MKLKDDWKDVARRAWSFRLNAVAGIMSGMEMALPLFTDAVPRGVFAVVAMAVSGLAMWARLVAQRNMQ